MIVTIFDGIGVTRVHAVIYHGDGKESPMCDVTSIGDQPMGDVTRVHAVIYHKDGEEQPFQATA